MKLRTILEFNAAGSGAFGPSKTPHRSQSKVVPDLNAAVEPEEPQIRKFRSPCGAVIGLYLDSQGRQVEYPGIIKDCGNNTKMTDCEICGETIDKLDQQFPPAY